MILHSAHEGAIIKNSWQETKLMKKELRIRSGDIVFQGRHKTEWVLPFKDTKTQDFFKEDTRLSGYCLSKIQRHKTEWVLPFKDKYKSNIRPKEQNMVQE